MLEPPLKIVKRRKQDKIRRGRVYQIVFGSRSFWYGPNPGVDPQFENDQNEKIDYQYIDFPLLLKKYWEI